MEPAAEPRRTGGAACPRGRRLRPWLAFVRVGPVLDLALEDQLRQILHALGIEDAVEMVALMLHHPGVKSLGRALDRLAVEPDAPVADMRRPLDPAAHPRHRKTALPAALDG